MTVAYQRRHSYHRGICAAAWDGYRRQLQPGPATGHRRDDPGRVGSPLACQHPARHLPRRGDPAEPQLPGHPLAHRTQAGARAELAQARATEPRASSPRSRREGKSPGKASSSPSKGAKGGKSKGSPGIKTARFTASGKPLCKPFNDSRGCTAPSCSSEHVCDVLLPSNVACGQPHPRSRHTGPSQPL